MNLSNETREIARAMAYKEITEIKMKIADLEMTKAMAENRIQSSDERIKTLRLGRARFLGSTASLMMEHELGELEALDNDDRIIIDDCEAKLFELINQLSLKERVLAKL